MILCRLPSGMTYQLLIKPPEAGHGYVRASGRPQHPQSIQRAFFSWFPPWFSGADEGDIAHSSQYPVPPTPRAPAVAATLVASLSVIGRRGRRAPACSQDERRGQGRGRRTRNRSSSEPVLSEDDTKTSDSEEAVSRHSESESETMM
ncbi:uncharacterized protein LOC114268882 [Camellia sinensis]|uniref:uncharacterized protein LOC114268882 n=1 Tax=Camellia sinensis TaxID=4442 RepID=UPI00103605A2|nr:uncharacterized protein LOC114268882 [Camellia sinensis]